MVARVLLPLAVAGMLLLAIGCGGTSKPATDLQIRVHDFPNARTYHLACEPAGGTLPDPAAACKTLAVQSGLLVGGIGFDHTCPSAPWTEVVGGSRGKRVSIIFSACRDVPGQASASDWLKLVGYRSTGPNRFGHSSSNAPLQSVVDRRRWERSRTSFMRRAVALGKEAKRLRRIREAKLQTGKLSLAAAMRPDPLTRRILQLDALAAATVGGYTHPGAARLYVAGEKSRRKFFVTVIVGADHLSMTYDARNLTNTMWGIGPPRPTRIRRTRLFG